MRNFLEVVIYNYHIEYEDDNYLLYGDNILINSFDNTINYHEDLSNDNKVFIGQILNIEDIASVGDIRFYDEEGINLVFDIPLEDPPPSKCPDFELLIYTSRRDHIGRNIFIIPSDDVQFAYETLLFSDKNEDD